MSPKRTCPNCDETYETKYESREDAPPRSIGREQFQTGICSDECWDEWLGLDGSETDGGEW